MCLKTMEKIDEAKLPSFIFSMGFKHMLASFLADSGSNATVLKRICPTYYQRSTWDILWSCLAAILACSESWVSIDPNIQPPT